MTTFSHPDTPPVTPRRGSPALTFAAPATPTPDPYDMEEEP